MGSLKQDQKLQLGFLVVFYKKSNFSHFTKGSRLNEKADAICYFTGKSASLDVGVGRSVVISKSLLNFTFTALFSTPKRI